MRKKQYRIDKRIIKDRIFVPRPCNSKYLRFIVQERVYRLFGFIDHWKDVIAFEEDPGYWPEKKPVCLCYETEEDAKKAIEILHDKE